MTLRLAWRNLWRHKRRTWITAGAMIFSNLLLIFMISLQFGSYQMMIDNTLKAYTGHLQIQAKGYNDDPKIRNSFSGIISLADKIRQQMGTNRVAARGVAFAMVSSEQRSYGLQIVGVEPAFEPNVSSLPGLMVQGAYFSDLNAQEIVVGSVLARNLRLSVGDELTLLGSGRDGSFAAGVVVVKGVFESGMAAFDRSMAQVPLGYFQSLFSMQGEGQGQGQGHAIVIDAEDLDGVPELQDKLSKLIADRSELVVLDWTRLQPGLKQAIQADMTSAWFMYAVLIVLVAFSVLNTQLMSVLERTREFGVMLALGFKPRRLGAMVITETVLISALGLLIGVMLGYVLIWYLSGVGFSYPGMDQMAARFNLPDRMYPSLSPLSLFLGPGIVFIFSVLASVYPAARLFFLQPVSAMRAA